MSSSFEPVCVMIERQVDRDPHRPALTLAGLPRTLRYGELDGLVNALAVTLADNGVRKGDLVPVLLVNSLELPVANLALMKLGAAFVPLDPDWPTERLRETLDLIAPRLLLCADVAAVPAGFRSLAMSVDIDQLSPRTARPGVVLAPDDPVYGIFTSGTTGRGRCAVNRHGGLANRFRFMTRYFAATGAEVVLQNSKHTFDSSVWQLLWPLTTGARGVIPAQGAFLNLEHTIETIAEHRVSVTDFVPSVFNTMVAIAERDAAARQKLAGLRDVVVGGEEITPATVHRLMGMLPGLRISNGYGPTEASIGMIFHRVSASDGDVIPLGRPIDNCFAVVVDEALRPLPPGEIGQIVIGGACLGAGYHADPAGTAEVFVDNPFPHLPGDRVYLTGDLGHADADGRLFFAGRRDFQVKIGGVRIELGEIETAAERCPGVLQAKVVLTQRAGSRALALFASGDPDLTDTGLRAHLAAILPRCNLPTHCFVLRQMPLTEHGKADRRALAALLDEALHADAPLDDTAPPDDGNPPGPEQVVRVFRAVLGRPGLDTEADFMSCGGDSLRAVTAVLQLRADCAIDLGVQDLFDHPTASRMAALIDARRAGAEVVAQPEERLIEADVAAVRPAPVGRTPTTAARETRRVLVTGATGFVGCRLVHDLLTSTDVTVCGLVRAPDDDAALRRMVATLAARRLWQPRFAARVEAHAGDLSRPDLGLAASVWDHLARTTDLVLHNGALVNMLYDYRVHRAANVLGTGEILRLALAYHSKPVHYISTLGVLGGGAGNGRGALPEGVPLSRLAAPDRGYSRSKWAAERCLDRARRDGALVTVFRLGEVMPSQDGLPNPRALTHLLLSAFRRLGMVPDAVIRSDYTPLDYVGARVVAGVHDRDVWGSTLHLFHPHSVDFVALLPEAGRPLARVPCREFLSRLDADRADRQTAALLAMLEPRPASSEADLRDGLGRLLGDTPRLFRKDACVRLEERWLLADPPLQAPIAAYRDHLDRDHLDRQTATAPAVAS